MIAFVVMPVKTGHPGFPDPWIPALRREDSKRVIGLKDHGSIRATSKASQ